MTKLKFIESQSDHDGHRVAESGTGQRTQFGDVCRDPGGVRRPRRQNPGANETGARAFWAIYDAPNTI